MNMIFKGIIAISEQYNDNLIANFSNWCNFFLKFLKWCILFIYFWI